MIIAKRTLGDIILPERKSQMKTMIGSLEKCQGLQNRCYRDSVFSGWSSVGIGRRVHERAFAL